MLPTGLSSAFLILRSKILVFPRFHLAWHQKSIRIFVCFASAKKAVLNPCPRLFSMEIAKLLEIFDFHHEKPK
jgi:hypothetical protein